MDNAGEGAEVVGAPDARAFEGEDQVEGRPVMLVGEFGGKVGAGDCVVAIYEAEFWWGCY